MPLDPVQCLHIKQHAITATWEAERLTARDVAIALLREIADLGRDQEGDVVIGTDADVHSDRMARFDAVLATDGPRNMQLPHEPFHGPVLDVKGLPDPRYRVHPLHPPSRPQRRNGWSAGSTEEAGFGADSPA
jgi:hypothetical protein